MSITEKRRRVVLGPRLAGTLMSPEEFDAVTRCNENYRYELIRGVLVVTPVPLAQESDPNEELGMLLRIYRREHPLGSSLDATLPEQYVNTGDGRRRADRLIWAGLGRVPDVRSDLPTIAIEFVSRAKRDRHRDYVEKRAEYLDLGIAEYWVVDRFRRIMTVCRNGVEDQILQEADIYQSPVLPGFELALARLFALADRWDRPRS